jgi:mannose-6-phosphate isomerase-like protein (cupin superfamily)
MLMVGTEETRPWGRFIVLHEGEDCKVKVLEVEPGKRLSYQSHKLRSERWTVVKGVATVILDDVESKHSVGDVVVVEREIKHRLINNTSDVLRIIEVQIGDYYGEDDIIRFSDDYGRN